VAGTATGGKSDWVIFSLFLTIVGESLLPPGQGRAVTRCGLSMIASMGTSPNAEKNTYPPVGYDAHDKTPRYTTPLHNSLLPAHGRMHRTRPQLDPSTADVGTPIRVPVNALEPPRRASAAQTHRRCLRGHHHRRGP